MQAESCLGFVNGGGLCRSKKGIRRNDYCITCCYVEMRKVLGVMITALRVTRPFILKV